MQWSSLAGFGGYKQKPDPPAGYPGYPMVPTSILGISSRAEAFGTSISRIVCTNKLSDFQGKGMKMLNCLIYLDGRKASFLISLSYLPFLLLSPSADLVTRLQL